MTRLPFAEAFQTKWAARKPPTNYDMHKALLARVTGRVHIQVFPSYRRIGVTTSATAAIDDERAGIVRHGPARGLEPCL